MKKRNKKILQYSAIVIAVLLVGIFGMRYLLILPETCNGGYWQFDSYDSANKILSHHYTFSGGSAGQDYISTSCYRENSGVHNGMGIPQLTNQADCEAMGFHWNTNDINSPYCAWDATTLPDSSRANLAISGTITSTGCSWVPHCLEEIPNCDPVWNVCCKTWGANTPPETTTTSGIPLFSGDAFSARINACPITYDGTLTVTSKSSPQTQINVYSLQNNQCNYRTILVSEKQSSDYDSLSACQVNIVVNSTIEVYRFLNNQCSMISIDSSDKKTYDYNTLAECQSNISVSNPAQPYANYIYWAIGIIIAIVIGIIIYARRR